MSNVSKGNYYKAKTKKWFLSQGYQCDYLEKMMWIKTKKGMLPIKRDLFFSDGLAMNEKEIIFWQSKLGRANIADARNKYLSLKTPKGVKKCIVVWEVRKKPKFICI